MTEKHNVQTDLEIDAETWEEIAERTRYEYEQLGEDPAMAYDSAIGHEFELVPNVVVDGEPKGLEDIDGVPLPEVDDA